MASKPKSSGDRTPGVSLRATALLLGAALLALLPASPAAAHPLGNATVNHYDALELRPDAVVDRAVEDVAEIPTFQRTRLIDVDGDGSRSAGERASYAVSRCSAMAQALDVRVGGAALAFRATRSSYEERPGQGGLVTGRLECDLEAPADLRAPAQVSVTTRFDDDGLGWHEITATGAGVSLRRSPFPAASVSDALRAYPDDLLSSPLDVRSGTLQVEPGGGASTYDAVRDLPVAGPVARALDHLSRAFTGKVGAEHLTLGVGLLGMLLAVLLGAGHAFLPGHGKTIMAAYLVGRRGTLRDVVVVGATVTATHTAGVLVLGLALTSTTAFAPASAERWLGIASGLLVAVVGVGLLVSAVRRRGQPRLLGHHHHDHDDHHHHDHDPDRHDGHTHDHHHEEGHGFGRGGLLGLGIAGGLVPSPSALLVLLAATALGRTWFGVTLVLGYGVGMALALCAAGLLLVRLRSRFERWAGTRAFARADRLAAALPVLTALLVLTVGTGLALRAAGGSV